MKTNQELKDAGFTSTGISRFDQTVEEYSDTLFSKAVNFGKADKAEDLPLEVTHEHVRASAYSIAKTFGKNVPSGLAKFAYICEYVLTAVAGISGGNLEKGWGVPTFIIATAIAVILIATRLSKSK